MPHFKLSLKITDPPQIIERRIRTVVADKLNLALQRAATESTRYTTQLIDDYIKTSVEVKSLYGGDLQAELGPTTSSVESVVKFIITELVASIQVDVTKLSAFGSSFKGGVTISFFPKDFLNKLLQHPSSSYLTAKGENIPWVEWLTELGDQIIVKNYVVDYTKSLGSRTGLASMKEVKRKGWRVPPAYSGTHNNNFITRAFDQFSVFIAHTLRQNFLRNL